MGEVMQWDTVYHHQIMAVAIRKVDGTKANGNPLYAWSVLIGPVPGQNHDEEVQSVVLHGNNTSESFAKLRFPEVYKQAKREHWRYE